MYRKPNFIIVLPKKYEKVPSNLGYFSKIPAIFSTNMTVKKQQKYKITLSFLSTWGI